jgi:site-specific DNA-methyltransferase (adenine-specific)
VISIFNGKCHDVLSTLEISGPVIVLTDPPYDAKTHEGARTSGNEKLVTFDTIDVEYVRRLFAMIAERFELRWIIATMAYQHVIELERWPPVGVDFVRFGVWTKPNSMPQMTGDRPAQGWEAVAILHKKGRKRWNGGGLPAVWSVDACRDSRYPTEKPEALYSKFLQQFAEPGDTVLDPFCGSGTSLAVAKSRGLDAIGIDISPEAVKLATERTQQEMLFTRQVAVQRGSDQIKLFGGDK